MIAAGLARATATLIAFVKVAVAALAANISSQPALAEGSWTTITRPASNLTRLSYEELEQRWPRIKAQQKIIALLQLVKQARFDIAQRLLDRTKFGGGSALDARFVQAQIYKGQGKLKKATTIYRKILSDHPDNQITRVELAQTLYLMKEDASARHHFELALGSVTNRNLENNIRNFIDQIDRRKRWSLSTYVSLAPSTNFNQGTDNEVIYINGLPFKISDQGKSKSGVGVSGGINAGYRFAITDRLDLVTGGGFHFKEFEDKTYDDRIYSAQIGPRYAFTFGHVALYGTARRRMFGGKHYSKTVGARAQLGARLNKRALTSISVSYDSKRYDVADHLDGHSYYGSAYVDYFLSGSTYARLLGGGMKDRTTLEHLDSDSWHTGIGLYTELPWGVSIYGEARFTKRDYVGDFPFMDTGRSDKKYDIIASLTKRDWYWMGFAPKFEYGFTRNLSNVVLYDYTAHSANVTLTKKF